MNAWVSLDARLPWGGFKESGVGRDLSQSGSMRTWEKVVTIAMSRARAGSETQQQDREHCSPAYPFDDT